MRSGVPRGRMGNSKLGLAPQRPVALRFWHRDCWTAIIQSLRHFLSNVSSRWASGFWFRAFRVLGLLPGVLFATLGAWAADPVISELAAASQTVLKDEDGEYPDWIELHNPGVDRLNLRDWSLTDDPGEPRKWRFPERVLEPGGYLVVFASGKNRVGAGILHTSFRLDADGEYLGLFPPGGTAAVSQFAPTYPSQEPEISFGVPAAGAVRDLLAGSPVWVLVPSQANELPADWAAPGFVAGPSWQQGPGLGVGFDATPSGPDGIGNLAVSGMASQSSTGFGLGAELAIDGDPSTFTHTDSNDNDSTWWVDLGKTVEVRRIVVRNRDNCCASRLRDITVQLLGADGTTVVWSSELLNPENILASPASLIVDLDALNVGAVPARVVRVIRTPDPDLSGGNGNGDEDNVLSLGEVEVYGVETLSYGPLVRTDLTATLSGRSASAFVRVPFVLADPAAVRSLVLQLRYDDGAVVHLNGARVAGYNAPSTVEWNSVASGKRVKSDVMISGTLDLGPFRNQWRAGTNWLAIQGLNASAMDPDFLVEARLIAGTDAGVAGAYFEKPTPGAANDTPWTLGRVADTAFSVNRGRMSGPVDLEITTATPGAEIRYTLDGSTPDITRGQRYSGPIRIDRTRVVRAAAFLENYRPTDVDTHTYLFPEDTITQPSRPSGFPPSWAGVSGDYAMDPRITQSPEYSGRMEESLAALPTLALATEVDNLFGSTRGIYANPERNGVSWERPVSMEWINNDGTGRFQVNCGLRIQGGYFRDRNVTQKHSLRLLFKDEYGPGRLREDLFHEFGAAREFDTLVLRAGANDGYAWDAARDTEQFIRDEFGRRSLLAMGQVTSRGRFVHLYLNGLYWGLYNLAERPAEDFSASYFGGVPEEWDAINSGDVKSGSLEAWNAFLGGVRTVTTLADYQRLKGLNADGSRNPAYPEYLDGPNYMDYMLVNIWGGNWDWPNKNFWFGRHRGGLAGGFKFYLWDFENTMGNNRDRSPLSMVSPRSDIASSWVGEPHSRLRRFSEYRIEFADRVQRHLFADGALSPDSLIARYRDIANLVEPAVIAETARWGDDHFSSPQDLSDWRRERDWILGSYLPKRTGIVLSQLRSAGLYPQTDAPGLSPRGGPVSPVVPVLLSTTATELFYTTNGADPRLPGGAVHPDAVRAAFTGGGGPPPDPGLIRSGRVWRFLDDGMDPGAGWRETGFPDASWSTGPSPLGYGDGDEATVVGFVDTDPELAGVQKNATTWFRTDFEVTDPAAFERLRLTLTVDDGAAVFLNGAEVLRTDNLAAGAGAGDYASGSVADNTVLTLDDVPASRLRPGRNVVAVEVHQADGSSSDVSFDLTLDGIPGSSGLVHMVDPFFIAAPTTIRARARTGADWSALTEGRFVPDVTAATSNQLVISEFCYRPADSVTPAETAVSADRDDFEFLEVLNISGQAVDLTGVRFTSGILFNFPAGMILGGGKRLLLTSNRGAFEARYGTGLPVVPGAYEGYLANDGEELALVDAQGRDIRRFTYLDHSPWPPGPNRNGYSLVLKRPESAPDHRDPSNWRASVLPGGSPGGIDASPFTGDAEADADGNGQADLLDHALGADLTTRGGGMGISVEWFETGVGTAEHLVVSVPRNLAADDAVVTLEVAGSPGGPWRRDPGSVVLIREERQPGRPVRQSFRMDPPLGDLAEVYVRLSVALAQ